MTADDTATHGTNESTARATLDRRRVARWQYGFDVVGLLAALGLPILFQLDARPGLASRWLLMAAGATALVGVAFRLVGWWGRPFRYAGAATYFSMAILTYPFGGLAFLMPAGLLGASATLASWPTAVARTVRGVIGIAGVILHLSVGGAGLMAQPILLPLLAWSAATSGRRMRYLFIAIFGANVAISISVLWWVWGQL